MNAPVSNQLPNVFDYQDYREFLRDHYLARKATKKSFSYRFMASRLDMDPGQLAWVLKGKLHLAAHAVDAAISMCHLEGREAAYFEELTQLARARSEGELARSRERMNALRGVVTTALQPEQTSFYDCFHYSILRALAPLCGTADATQLGHECIPELDAQTVEQAMTLLQELKLLEKTPDGLWSQPDVHITSGKAIAPSVIRAFHLQAIEHAQRSLHEQDPQQRDISTLTVSIAAEDFPQVRSWLSDLRRQLQTLTQETQNPDRVLQFNAQLFPVGARTARKRLS